MWQLLKSFFEKTVQNKFLRNSLVLFLGTTIVNILNYVFHLVVGRTMSPGDYGEVEALVSLLTIVSVPSGVLTLIATKYAAEMKAVQDTQGTGKFLRYCNRKIRHYGIPILVFLVVVTPWVRSFLSVDSSWSVLFLWIVMILTFLSAITVGLLTGWQRFSDLNKVSISATLVKLGCVVLMVQIGWGVLGVWGGLALAAVFGYLASLFFLKRLVRWQGIEATSHEGHISISGGTLRSYAFPVFYGTLALAIFGNIDMIFAKHHLDAAQAGQYGALSIIAKTVFFIVGSLTTVLFAMSSEESMTSRRVTRTFWYAVVLTVLISFGAVLVFSLFPVFIVNLFFGVQYLTVAPLLGWFTLIVALYSLMNLFLQYLLSLHESRLAVIFLALSGLEMAGLFFFGGSLHAILAIVIIIQALAVITGGFFVLKQRNYGPNDINSHPGV